MLPEVQEHFARLTSPRYTRTYQEPLVRSRLGALLYYFYICRNMHAFPLPHPRTNVEYKARIGKITRVYVHLESAIKRKKRSEKEKFYN